MKYPPDFWIDPPLDKPPVSIVYVENGRLSRIDDALRESPEALFRYDDSGVPRLAIHDHRQPGINDRNHHIPTVDFMHLAYDDRGYLARIVHLKKTGDAPIALFDVTMHKYHESYNHGFEARYASTGDLQNYTRFSEDEGSAYINIRTQTVRGTNPRKRESQIRQLVRYGLEPFYPIPQPQPVNAQGDRQP